MSSTPTQTSPETMAGCRCLSRTQGSALELRIIIVTPGQARPHPPPRSHAAMEYGLRVETVDYSRSVRVTPVTEEASPRTAEVVAGLVGDVVVG